MSHISMQPMKAPIRVGIIGTGFGITGHLPAWRNTVDAAVTALCSVHPGRAKALAQEHGIAFAFDDVKQLVEHPEVDLVVVANGVDGHRSAVLAAAAAGKAILCEKPFALNTDQAMEMRDAADAAGVVNLVNFEMRNDPIVEAAVNALRSGRIGRLRRMVMTHFNDYVSAYQPYIGGWWFDRERGGGWLGAHGVHHVDMACHLFGPDAEIVSVDAKLNCDFPRPVTRDGPVVASTDDGYALNLEFSGGGQAVLISTAASRVPRPRRIELQGDVAHLMIEGDRVCLIDDGKGATDLAVEQRSAFDGDSHVPMMLAWTAKITAALLAGERLQPDFAQGVRVQRVLDAARRSADEGCSIEAG